MTDQMNLAAALRLADHDSPLPALAGPALKLLRAHLRSKESFQNDVEPWMIECFGAEIAGDTAERNHRFLEESLELVQACGCSVSEAHQLVDYVFGRPVGDTMQEVGGVMVTLAALCLAQHLDMHLAGVNELERVWTKVEQIRAKQLAKPKHSPLPQVLDGTSAITAERRRQIEAEGYAPEQDSHYTDDELLRAAAVYIGTACSEGDTEIEKRAFAAGVWPWPAKFFKPTSRRRDLERAGALIAAELDRMAFAEKSCG